MGRRIESYSANRRDSQVAKFSGMRIQTRDGSGVGMLEWRAHPVMAHREIARGTQPNLLCTFHAAPLHRAGYGQVFS
jgi:hypothetical protein